jgi:hypothetical protein
MIKEDFNYNIKEITNTFLKKNSKKLPKGKYKFVRSYELINGDVLFRSYIPKYKWCNYYKNEKIAAIEVDKFLLKVGETPTNVLVKKDNV